MAAIKSRGPQFGGRNVDVDVDDNGRLQVKTHPMFAKELGKALREIADLARKIVDTEHSKTFALRRSIQPYKGRAASVQRTGPNTISGTVTAGSAKAPYARFVHEGTKAHKIHASPGKLLSFRGSGKGGSKTFSRTRLRLMTDDDWAVYDNTQNQALLREHDRAARRSNRRGVAEARGLRWDRLRRRDADVVHETETFDYAERRVVTSSVNHPGYSGHQFLNQAAAIVVSRRYGGRVNLGRIKGASIKSR